jgi:hypothetical protein
MTKTNDAAGSSPGGVSDVRSTANVNDNLPCPCGKVRRCSASGCLDDATIVLNGGVPRCDLHAGDLLRRHLRRAQLADVDYDDDVIDLDDVVGQAVYERHALNYPRRGRITLTKYATTTFAFRHGHVECDRCGASWIGVEHELCPWCLRRACLLSDRRRPGGRR